MASSVTGSITVGWSFTTLTTGGNSLGSPKAVETLSISQAFTSGTTSNAVDLSFGKSFTLSASATNTHDVAGSLVDGLGNTLTMAEVVGVLIYNTTLTTGSYLTVGADTNALINMLNAAGTVRVGPGGVFLCYSPVDGFAVTASTGDIIKVVNAGVGSTTYSLAIIGRSA
jgi:hypothetical protein